MAGPEWTVLPDRQPTAAKNKKHFRQHHSAREIPGSAHASSTTHHCLRVECRSGPHVANEWTPMFRSDHGLKRWPGVKGKGGRTTRQSKGCPASCNRSYLMHLLCRRSVPKKKRRAKNMTCQKHQEREKRQVSNDEHLRVAWMRELARVGDGDAHSAAARCRRRRSFPRSMQRGFTACWLPRKCG